MRRHLGMSEIEWRSTAWHVQRAYREGIVHEVEDRARILRVVNAVEHLLGIQETEPYDPDNIPAASDEDLRAAGVTITKA